MQIIFLIQSEFSKRDYDRFGIDTLSLKPNCKVEIWSFKDFLQKKPPFFDAQQNLFNNIVSIKSKKEFIQKISEIYDRAIFISFIPVNYKTIFIFRFLEKFEHNYGFTGLGQQPIVTKSIKQRLLQAFANPAKTIKAAFYYLLSYLFCNFKKITPDFFLTGGKIGDKKFNQNFINKPKEIISIHSFDYDLYLNLKIEDEKEKNYAVFIDQYVTDHPDRENKPIISSQDYYSDLNNFFDKVEELFKVEILIASHPRSSYKYNPFNSRKMEINKTFNLIKGSKFVISHGSTAISGAILFQKPIIFCYHSKFKVDYTNFLFQISDFFSRKPIEIRDLNALSEYNLTFDKNQYLLYKNLFIKKEDTKEGKLWDIFYDHFRN